MVVQISFSSAFFSGIESFFSSNSLVECPHEDNLFSWLSSFDCLALNPLVEVLASRNFDQTTFKSFFDLDEIHLKALAAFWMLHPED